MITLPPIEDRISKRPGNYKSKITQFIPNLEYDEFWIDFYERLSKYKLLKFPIKKGNVSIDPFFGYFGFRFHPITKQSHYFHVGMDVLGKIGTKIYPIAPGVFEYSGYKATNGNYILLSHPEIVTHDGYKLNSLYMHLDTNTIKFSKYQKMLREISRHTYPNINVPTTKSIGTLGQTGDLRGMVPHLHLQLEFHNRKGNIVVIDPAKLFSQSQDNLTKDIQSEDDFKNFISIHKEHFLDWKPYWDKEYFS